MKKNSPERKFFLPELIIHLFKEKVLGIFISSFPLMRKCFSLISSFSSTKKKNPAKKFFHFVSHIFSQMKISKNYLGLKNYPANFFVFHPLKSNMRKKTFQLRLLRTRETFVLTACYCSRKQILLFRTLSTAEL